MLLNSRTKTSCSCPFALEQLVLAPPSVRVIPPSPVVLIYLDLCIFDLTYPADESMLEQAMGLFARFKAAFPDWEGQPLTPLQSVTAVLNVVSTLTAQDSGACLSHNGGTDNWF